MDLSGYRLETLREDQELILARAHPLDETTPLLALLPVGRSPTSATFVRLEHELSLSTSLDPAFAVQPLRLARQRGRPTLLFADPGGHLLSTWLGGPLGLDQALPLAIALAASLRQVHARGLVHRDLKPDHVLVGPDGSVRLTGFGRASRQLRERQTPVPPEVIVGTLAYMAPEQTGRMNRSVDARADLYALGVILYQMLTGELPFAAADALEWIHCHVARQPLPPSSRSPGLPTGLDAIVLKLLAKEADERYQTALGLELDLRRSLEAWQAQGRIDPFALGAHDTPNRLLLPEKLYGRQAEIARLMATFGRVACTGAGEWVLISGVAGVGKSALVQELYKEVLAAGALFTAGKFDQYRQSIPYAPLAQALGSLVRQQLGRSETELGRWSEALLEAVGHNSQLVVELVPELALIIGNQPTMTDELPPQERQNRFHFVFRRLIGVFARPEHPLVLVLDDLQWLDTATLTLLEHLLDEPDLRHLLLIGTYRDSEIGQGHSLTRFLERIRQKRHVSAITLPGLAHESIEQLLTETLHQDSEQVQPLAELVVAKTAGNPLYFAQFLTALVEEHLLTFDHDSSQWQWSLERIASKEVTDNVADLLTTRLVRLPPPSRVVLQYLAGLGTSASAATLARALEWPKSDVHAALENIVHTGLVLRRGEVYTFAHDRVQEAAYRLVPKGKRPALHLQIGRALLSDTLAGQRDERILEICNHLNRGAALITSQAQRDGVASLNLTAARRAKAGTSYASALEHCVAGQQLLGKAGWTRQPQLAFELELNRAESEFLAGDLSVAEERLQKLMEQTDDIIALSRILCLLLQQYRVTNRDDQAVTIGLGYLRRIGIAWSAHPTDAQVEREYEQLISRVATRPIKTLIDLPVMSDPAHRAVMEVLEALNIPAAFTDRKLHALVAGRAAIISLEHGICDASASAFCALGHIPQFLEVHFGDARAALQTAIHFGQLAYDLVEKRGLTRFRARIYAVYAITTMVWLTPLRDSIAVLQRAFDASLETGDPTFASFAHNWKLAVLLSSGAPLAQVQSEAEESLQFAHKAGFGYLADITLVQLRLVLALRGLTPSLGSLSDADFDQEAFERNLEANPVRSIRAYRYWTRKLQVCFLAGDIAAALQAADKVRENASKASLNLEVPEYHFYSALALAARCAALSADARSELMAALGAHHQQLALWAEEYPPNFADRATLVAAEIARLEGFEFKALRLYDEAIRLAQEQGFVHNEALALELATRFCEVHGLKQLGDTYLHNARSCYLRWGADGKVRQLEQLYPQLRSEPAAARPDSTLDLPITQLDLAAVLRVSQAISGEIDLASLLDTLMRLALEHSGATRGLLLLPRSGGMQIEAEALTRSSSVNVQVRQQQVSWDQLPLSVLHYVIRTRQSVVLANAADKENSYTSDPYIGQSRPRSLLCLPLQNQNELIGVIYLENRLASNVFDAARLLLLDLIASQAAVALENARLYATTEQARQEARQSATEFKLAFDMIPTLAWQTSPAGTVEALNQRFLDYTGLPLEDALSGQWLNAFHPDDAGHVFAIWQECLASGNSGEAEARLRRSDGVYRSFLVRAAPMRNEHGEIVRWFGTNIDVEDLKRAERLLAEEKRLLEMVATGRPPPEVLEALCRAVESLAEGTCASILLLDPATKCLRHGAAPSLPASYTTAVDGLLIGPRAGSCGTAAYRGEPVFVADIATDPLWAEHADVRDLALAQGLWACWSSPIWASAGTVLGTFALYARQARPIAAEEERLVEQFTHIASIAIERGRMDVDLRASLAEKEALLKEVHHRVKNNLQLISSLLSLQAGRIDTPAMAEQFAESRNRVRAMALVHENLYRTGSFARINMAGHIRALCAQLMRAYGLQGQAVALTPQVAEVEFDLDRAVAVGLIVNELVSNALKHAFPDGRAGRVKVRLERQEDGMCCLTVADNGVGLPAELEVEQASTMGLQLLRMLTDQLHGSVAITREGGTTFTIAFPER